MNWKIEMLKRKIASFYRNEWTPIIVSVDILISTLITYWAMTFLPISWQLGWMDLMAVIVIIDVALLGTCMLINRRIPNTYFCKCKCKCKCKCDQSDNEDIEYDDEYYGDEDYENYDEEKKTGKN
jgi:hypothetical protein